VFDFSSFISVLLVDFFPKTCVSKVAADSTIEDPNKLLAKVSSVLNEVFLCLIWCIRQAALEIGVAHTTLSRYLRKENKRQNNKNDVKMLNWLKEKALTSL